MFAGCENIIEINCSKIDCSQIIDCSYMFYQCSSLKIINLGKLDFFQSKDFASMFSGCTDLEELYISHFNTQNSLSFRAMFNCCFKLKSIDVSKFNTSKCKDITNIFCDCSSITEINMFNWDMSSLQKDKDGFFVNGIFDGCSNLKTIIMSGNFKYKDLRFGITCPTCPFDSLPNNGTIIWKKGNNINNILQALPNNWVKQQI